MVESNKMKHPLQLQNYKNNGKNELICDGFFKKLIWPQWQIAWPYQDAVSIMWLVGAVFMCMCTCRQGRECVCVFLYPLSGMGWLMFVCCCSGCYSQFTWQWWGLWFGLRVDTLILPLRKKLLGERGSEELSTGVREWERKGKEAGEAQTNAWK